MRVIGWRAVLAGVAGLTLALAWRRRAVRSGSRLERRCRASFRRRAPYRRRSRRCRARGRPRAGDNGRATAAAGALSARRGGADHPAALGEVSRGRRGAEDSRQIGQPGANVDEFAEEMLRSWPIE